MTNQDNRQPQIEMKNLTPRHINENESDNRGVKEGWYACAATAHSGSDHS
jgi:hypothetical protein